MSTVLERQAARGKLDPDQLLSVLMAIKKGDFSARMPLNWTGVNGKIADTLNDIIEINSRFSRDLDRVSKEVGKEGKLKERMSLGAADGAWARQVESVNTLIFDLGRPTTDMARVIGAVAKGDLTQKMMMEIDGMPIQGEFMRTGKIVNTMVDQLGSFASEVTRVAREVGTEGKLGGQAQVQGMAGTWKDLTDNVNSMATNLTDQVRNIAEVTTAVANGDLSKQITVDVKGEILELKDTINTMVDQLGSFASEVTRVAREVGTEGKLGGQAQVQGVAGTWKDLTDNVNSMAGNLTGQVRNIAEVTTAVANGDLSKKITVDVKGEILELKDTINTMVDQLGSFASEVTRVAREVGTEGKLDGQAHVRGVAGIWKDLTDNVNSMASNLTGQVRNIAEVTTAVANGDLSKKITVSVKGEILELKNTINTMVDQLGSFASEVTRVAREVGTEGNLGGQAQVRGVAGTWKDLTDNVNSMASNLTSQVRGIARVVTAVANGDLKKKLTVEAKGEIAELAATINNMIDTLATFADQVTSVAREVGVEGKLGGQARVPGASGTWKDLTDNVNQLAANLTTQVRAIADVATAVTRGDLTRSIGVAAEGEVAILKDNINEMIRNLRDTTEKNNEQDWLKTNLARFTRILQGQREMLKVCKLILSELAPLVRAQHGVFYVIEGEKDDTRLNLLANYASRQRKGTPKKFRLGESLVGECALAKERILLTDVPGDYVHINSGLGKAAPMNLVVLPVLFEGATKAVIELASFEKFSPTHLTFLEQLTESIGIVLNTIEANSRTEMLLQQSQSMAKELQSQQEELQQTNEELEEKAMLLEKQNAEVERKNQEVEIARMSLEEKASQLALTSKYKSEFLANMSHELRTPLNSLLLLAEQLCDNTDDNLSHKQVEYAKTIYESGHDLLNLINDILDLSKIESGTSKAEIDEVALTEIRNFIEQTFRHIADSKNLNFDVTLDNALPTSMYTDERRLKQIVKNLLSNAFKFTTRGSISLGIQPAAHGWTPDHPVLSQAGTVLAFAVHDTGIGISPDKQQVIFEAFQQADGTTSRNYGGTGLGLAISRELAVLLGGEIILDSEFGQGSTFTLYLPLQYVITENQSDDDLHKPAQGPGNPLSTAAFHSVTAGGEGMFKNPWSGAATDLLPAANMAESVDDDRQSIQPGDKVVLIIENDFRFAGVLKDFAHKRGFKALVAVHGLNGLSLARQYRPDAITLDVNLPDANGWMILDLLKHHPATRPIPAYIISLKEEVERSLKLGALACTTKTADEDALANIFKTLEEFLARKVKNLMVVEDNPLEGDRIKGLLESEGVQITMVETGANALAGLKEKHFDCLVLDLLLPDTTGFKVLENIKKEPALKSLPVVVNTARDLTQEEEKKLKTMTPSIVVKNVSSPDRLLDEVMLYLHRSESDLTESKRKIIEQVRKTDPSLNRRKVLIVDDDMRNIFSLTALMERYGMEVISAENGKTAIELLKKNPGIEIILMDVMMPEMDGYDTMRAIRMLPKYKSLPIISLTAKAMKGDREKCIDAGASDYITKPVNTEQLLSLLRVWLYS